MKKTTILIDSIITSLCLFSAYWLHISTFINWDVAWHVEGARRLLSGGSYLVNVFDNNSLFVFAYYFPVILLKRTTSFLYPNLINIYITLTTIIPLTFCYLVIHKVFNQKKIFVKRFLYYTIIFILLFLPASNYGNREIVLIIFFLPYFLINILTTTYPKSLSVSKWLAYISAILASFGIAQNIFYISIPLFLDLYRFIKIRKFSNFQILFYSCLIIYAAIVAFLYPEYVHHIIPMVLCYESAFNFPLVVLMLEILTFISLLTVTIVLLNFKRLYKSDDIIMSFIATFCALLIYFLNSKFGIIIYILHCVLSY